MSTPDTTDTVWYSYGMDTYHEDKDCHHCGEAAMAKDRATAEHLTPCPYCAGGTSGETGPKGRTCPYCGDEQSHLAVHLRNSTCGTDE